MPLPQKKKKLVAPQNEMWMFFLFQVAVRIYNTAMDIPETGRKRGCSSLSVIP